MPRQDLAAFAGAIVHELRTPLTVISGEVELALARHRSPAAYHEALSRIAERVAELIDLTRDFAFLGDSGEFSVLPAQTVPLTAVFEALADRYGPRRGTPLTLTGASLLRSVAGDGTLITGALALLVEHAARHRRSGSQVQLRALPPEEATVIPRTIDLVLDAAPGGFSPSAWQALSVDAGADEHAHGELRLQTAARIIHGCGGSLDLTSAGGAERLLIRLRSGSPPDAVDGIQ
jgi:signal transduction histidine kinase